MNASDLAARLHARRATAGWLARCPAHDDRRPSLSISEGRDGRTLVRCFAGCAPESITNALGLKLGDLFEDDTARQRVAAPRPRRVTADDVERALHVELERILGREEQLLGFRPAMLTRFLNEARGTIEARLSVKLRRRPSPWWEIEPHCVDPQWKACVDRAIEEAAWKHDVEPSWLSEHVAEMASVSDSVLVRARALLRELAAVAA